jgi:fructose-1,6-bisphosphatase/inositol monophosphatase family enzyme
MTQISAYDLGLFIKAALREVYLDHISLSTEGQIVRDALNQFGERSLVADFRAEEIVIARLRVLAERHRVTILVIAEEHDDLTIGDSADPDYIVYIDGLDGSSVYATATQAQLRFNPSNVPFNRRPRYGTMVGIVGSGNRYADVLAAGILEPMTNRVLIATKGRGISVAHPTQIGRGRRVHTTKQWDPLGLIYCDRASLANRTIFEGPIKAMYSLETVSAGSAARYYLDVAIGRALASCEWTRKRCLEVVTGYLIVTEAGGFVCDLAGLDIGSHNIAHWGSGQFTSHFIAAGSPGIAKRILEAVLKAISLGDL